MVLGISKSERRRVSVDVKDPKLPILTVLLELSACFSSYWSIFLFGFRFAHFGLYDISRGLQSGSLGSHISTHLMQHLDFGNPQMREQAHAGFGDKGRKRKGLHETMRLAEASTRLAEACPSKL